MSNAMMKIYVRTIRRRMEEGESLDDILASYPKLTKEELKALRNEIEV
jgi:uncharacterized protein (DUF433 family)